MTWGGMRKKLEQEYLAESLRGHITYFVSRYNKQHDQEGRAAIRLDGKEIIKGCFYNNYAKRAEFPVDEKYEKRIREEFAFMDDDALRLGIFDQRCFYEAFEKFDGQSIEESLHSDNELVRIFAILDRRTGKRRIRKLLQNADNEPDVIREFIVIRARAEGLSEE